MSDVHEPVLADRVVALLGPAIEGRAAVVVDATVGFGGHADALLRSHPQLRLIGLDRDPAALASSADRLAPYGGRITLVPAVYDELPRVLATQRTPRIDGILFDLGVSSAQLDDAARGFSYARDAALDMRMNPVDARSAADVVNGYSAAELASVLRRYGEERFARRIAEAIVAERSRGPLTSTARLAELVREAIPAATRRTGGHPAKRTFQALRIEVNDELGALSRALPEAVDALRRGGRIVVLSYHSLEDRRVKRAFAAAATPSAPPDLPVVPPEARPRLHLLTRGAERPGHDEVARNPRAASARLRAAERTKEAA
jgi:16S rRNA (cytosine1402-N4)-methyltransferase